MKIPFKNIFIVFALFLFTFLFFKYREGFERSEWITPGDRNRDRYYNEHKTSGNPEIDAIEFNHHAKKPSYIDSSKYTTIVDIDPIKRVSEWRSKVKKLIDLRLRSKNPMVIKRIRPTTTIR
jgi:hypothetical protein